MLLAAYLFFPDTDTRALVLHVLLLLPLTLIGLDRTGIALYVRGPIAFLVSQSFYVPYLAESIDQLDSRCHLKKKKTKLATI